MNAYFNKYESIYDGNKQIASGLFISSGKSLLKHWYQNVKEMRQNISFTIAKSNNILVSFNVFWICICGAVLIYFDSHCLMISDT